MYRKSDIQKLIDELNIVQVIEEYVSLKKTGSNYKGLSPFKEERTPSFVVSPQKKIFKDFSSNIAGNVITFYQKINNVSLNEAIAELAKKYNINISPINGFNENEKEFEEYYQIMEDAQIFFTSQIEKSTSALLYMENRNYMVEDIKKFGIGFSSNRFDSLLTYLIEKGYHEDKLLELGLVRKNEIGQFYDYYRNRIMFPIYNSGMKIVGFGGRIIENDENSPKYLNSPDTKIFKKGSEVFGLYNRGEEIKKRDYAILMEGYLDVLTAHKYGFLNAVASLGTALTKEQAKLISRYTKNIIISYDNDNAGKLAVEKASYILKNQGFNVKCVTLTGDSKDPDEFLQLNGREEYVTVLQKSKDIFDYLYDNFSKNINLNDILGKKELINRFKPFFSNLSDRIEIVLYIEKLSVELGISKEDLKIEYSEYLNNYTNKSNYYTKNRKNGKPFLKNSNVVEKVSNKLTNKEKKAQLERETLKFLLKFYSEPVISVISHCKKLLNKEFLDDTYKSYLSQLKENNFDVLKIKESMDNEEDQKNITMLKLESDEHMNDEEKQYKDLYVSWFEREIDDLLINTNRTDTRYIRLKQLRSKLVSISDILQIEQMYNEEFKLMKESDYV